MTKEELERCLNSNRIKTSSQSKIETIAGVVEDFDKYLKKKKAKIGHASHGFGRGQRDLIAQIAKRFKKIKRNYGL